MYSSTTKTGRHDIAEILLKVALSTINQIIKSNHFKYISLFYRLKLHEDWGTTPAAIDTCLNVAEKFDIQVRAIFIVLYMYTSFELIKH